MNEVSHAQRPSLRTSSRPPARSRQWLEDSRFAIRAACRKYAPMCAGALDCSVASVAPRDRHTKPQAATMNGGGQTANRRLWQLIVDTRAGSVHHGLESLSTFAGIRRERLSSLGILCISAFGVRHSSTLVVKMPRSRLDRLVDPSRCASRDSRLALRPPIP